MKEFFKSKIFNLILAVFLIGGGVSILAFMPGNNFISYTADLFAVPLQKLSATISNNASDAIKKEKEKEQYEAEIEKLKKEIKDLRTLTIDYMDIKKQNAQYFKFYEIKKQNESLKFAPACVIARDPSEMFYGFIIDQGKNSGITVNSPVITENGIIGVVTWVGETSSRVKTILSPEVKIGSVDKNSSDTGVLIGNAKNASENLTRLMYIPTQNNVKTEDIAVTAGVGGLFPKDMPLGKVKELLHNEDDSSLYALIEPFDDIRSLRDVFVVTDFSGKGNMEANIS